MKKTESQVLELSTKLSFIKASVSPIFDSHQENLVAVANVTFMDSSQKPVCEIKGFRIISEDPFTLKQVTIHFPSYSSRKGRFYPTFAGIDEMFEQEITEAVMTAYAHYQLSTMPEFSEGLSD